MPVAGLGRLDGELHLLAEARTRRTGIHTQLVHDLQTVGGGILQRRELDVLDVELGLQQIVVRLDGLHVPGHHGELGKGLAHADLGGLAQGQSAGNDLADLLHRGDQSRIVNQNATKFGIRTGLLVHHERPIGQVARTRHRSDHATRTRLHRGERRKHAHERLKHGVQRVERGSVLIPETVTGVADIPVGEHVDEVGDASQASEIANSFSDFSAASLHSGI